MKPYRRPHKEPVKQTPKKSDQIQSASCGATEIKLYREARPLEIIEIDPPKKNGRDVGFTLMEIMVSVSIIAILAAMATPSYIKRVENARKRATVENTATLCEAVHDILLTSGLQEKSFGQLPASRWQELEDLLTEGLEGCEVVGYSFHPEALNNCYISIVAFKGVSDSLIYIPFSTP